jgi:hypothetical protein
LEIGRRHRVSNEGIKVCGGWQPFLFRWVRTEVWDGALSWRSSQVCSRQSSERSLHTFSRSRRKTSQ